VLVKTAVCELARSKTDRRSARKQGFQGHHGVKNR
jgi:hypothetical protein